MPRNLCVYVCRHVCVKTILIQMNIVQFKDTQILCGMHLRAIDSSFNSQIFYMDLNYTRLGSCE